jgi:hypothetical protein
MLDSGSAWGLSADGKKLSWVSKSNPGRIDILDIPSGAKSAINLKGWQVRELNWAPDNEHLYIYGAFGPNYTIASVGFDGRTRSIVSVTAGQGALADPWPSPDGRSLGFTLKNFEGNAVMLENF